MKEGILRAYKETKMIQKSVDSSYVVVINTEEQYSIWPLYRAIPEGWRAAGMSGTKQECLDYIANAWIDMRPASLRKAIAESGDLPS